MSGAGNRGVTLVELLIIIAVIAILCVSLGFSYQGWMANYRIESQMKQLYADLMEARTRALTRSLFCYFVVPTTHSYQIYEDTNGNNGPKPDLGSDLPFWSSPKALDGGHNLKMFSAGSLPSLASPLTIDTRGLTNAGAATIYFGIDHGTDLTPDYDCIIVTQSRIRMGKWNGGASCAEK